jgi:S-(hydroxymethyl)glutathione dehydrogenase/alcohol dehydrogenase
MGYRITKEKGRVILVGVPKNGVNISIYSLPLHFGKGLTGSHGGGTMPEESIERYYNLYRQGKFNLRKLITDNYSLENINHAIGDMRNGIIAGRCMISMD